MGGPPDLTCEHREGCITCGDQAVEMTVVEVDRERGLALCEAADGRGRETVEIALVDPVHPGDALLVHAATALARIPAREPHPADQPHPATHLAAPGREPHPAPNRNAPGREAEEALR